MAKVCKLKVPDKVLVDRALRGSAVAFRELYERHRSKVRGLSVKFGYALELEDDIEQEAWILIWRKLHSWRGDAAFTSWVYRITANAALMAIRNRGDRAKKEEASELVQYAEDRRSRQDRVMYSKQVLKVVSKKLKRMKPEYSKVIFARDICDFSNEEVAAALDISIPAVKSRTNRGRMMLKQHLATFKDVVNF